MDPPPVEIVSIEAENNRGRNHLKNVFLASAVTVGSFIGGVVGIKLAGTTEGEVCDGTATVEIEHNPVSFHRQPSLVLEVAPEASASFKDVTANPFLHTHVRITGLDKQKVETLRTELETASETDLKKFEEGCRDDTRALAIRSGEKALLFGGLGATLGSLATFEAVSILTDVNYSRRRRAALLFGCNLVAFIPGFAPLVWATQTVNEDSLHNPTYHGYLYDLAEVVDTSEHSLKEYQQKSGELTRWLEQAANLREKLLSDSPPQYPAFLIVSDIHSRPCAYERIKQLADAYDVEFVLNDGDEREWSESETGLLLPKNGCHGINGPQDLTQPVRQIKGNHDNDETMAALDALKNVQVVDGIDEITYTWQGRQYKLKLLGIPDKRYTPDDKLNGKVETKNDLLGLYDINELKKGLDQEPDIIATHDPELYKELNADGLLPSETKLLSAGHLHKASIDQKTYTSPLIITGSSGGGGLRTYQQKDGQDSAYSVVYFNPETKQPVRIELVAVSNDGAVSIRNVEMSETN